LREQGLMEMLEDFREASRAGRARAYEVCGAVDGVRNGHEPGM